MAGGSVFYSIEITSRIDKTYRNGDSINANITKKSGEFPEGAYVTSGRLTFSDLRVFTRHEAGFNFGEWFTASETKVNEGGGFYAFEDVSVSDNIIDLISDSVTVDIFGPEKLESGLYAFKTKSATLEVKYEIRSEEPDDGEPDDGEDDWEEDDSYEDFEEDYSFTISPNTIEDDYTVISINSLSSGKKFTLSHNFPKVTNPEWTGQVYLETIEDYELYYKDSINTSWRLVENETMYFGKKLPSSVTIKTSNKLLFECPLTISFYLDSEEIFEDGEYDYVSYSSDAYTYWIGVEENKYEYWNFSLTGAFSGRKPVIKKDAFLTGVSGYVGGNLAFSSSYILSSNPVLKMYASLKSNTPLYMSNYTILPRKAGSTSESSNSEKYQEFPKEGVSLPTGQELITFLEERNNICTFYTDNELENGDVITITIEGTINGVYNIWGQNIVKITSATACKFPTSTSLSCEKEDEKGKYILDRFTFEWHGADDGEENEIIAYEFYKDNQYETCIKKIETNLKDGRCYLPSPPSNGILTYYLKVVGSSGDSELDAKGPIGVIRRASITPIKDPDSILLESDWEDDFSYLIVHNTLSGQNNLLNKYQIQRKELFNNGEESGWLSLEEFSADSMIINDIIDYTGDYEFYRNERGEEVFKAKSNGILTIKEDGVFDIFAVGGGASGSNYRGGGGGYTKTIFNQPLTKNCSYHITIGEGGQQIDQQTGGDGHPTFMKDNDLTTIIKANGGFGIYYNSSTSFGGRGGSGGKAIDGADGDGKGQGSTTKAFMDTYQSLYASGGISSDPNAGDDSGQNSRNAAANFGCGGGKYNGNTDLDGGTGGSGTILIRKCNSIILPINVPEDYNKKYAFRVRCVGEAGIDFASAWVESDKYLSRDLDRNNPFTDDPIIPRETFVKAQHMIELQEYINKMCELYQKNQEFNFSTIIAEETSLADWTNHINEIRQAFDTLNSPHEEWKEILINQPNAEIITQIRNILKQGNQIKVEFYNGDEKIHTQYVRYGSNISYNGPTPTKKGIDFSYEFDGWSTSRFGISQKDATNCITSETKLYACYKVLPAIYEVVYRNGNETMYTDIVKAYEDSIYLGEVLINKEVPDPENYILNYWNPEPLEVTENLICYPEFIHKNLVETIRDSWEEIIENINNGTYISKYKIGDTKPLYLGEELGWVNMIFSGMSLEDTTDENQVASTTWISKQILPIAVNGEKETATVTPWDTSKVREILYTNVYSALPEVIKNNITPIIKNIQGNNYLEELWLPSVEEVRVNGKYSITGQTPKKNLDGVLERWIANNGYFYNDIGTVDSDNFPLGSGTSGSPTFVKYYYYPILCFCIGTTDKYLE